MPQLFVTVTLAIALLFASCGGGGGIAFHDAKQQSLEFMEWERTIQLDAAQEQVKRAALEALPAPCCGEYSAYTCCCSCNVSRTIWGLANYLIAKENADADFVREKTREWIAFVNPSGYSGKVCSAPGGCARPFAQDGCGGMDANNLVF